MVPDTYYGGLKRHMPNQETVETNIVCFIIGDPKLDKIDERMPDGKINASAVKIGGAFLRTLRELPGRLKILKKENYWTLILRIHGEQTFLSNTTSSLVNMRNSATKKETCKKLPDCYDDEKIKTKFGEKSFQEWRNKYGPGRLVLNACQVQSPLEGALIALLLRPGAQQKAYGLGRTCRPDTTAYVVDYKPPRMKRYLVINKRITYNKLSQDGKKVVVEKLRLELNAKYGYFGAPPVKPDAETLLRYYFDELPKNRWAVVTVSKEKKDTDIPFYNRGDNPRFLDLCSEHTPPLHTPPSSTIPPAMPSILDRP
jgi:hypothetical protein